MLNIIADTLFVATRFTPPTGAHSYPRTDVSLDAVAPKRTWAQIVGFAR